MSLKDLCSRLGGAFKKRKYEDVEWEVCRIPIRGETPYQKRGNIYEILQEISEFAQSELNLEKFSLGTTFSVSKSSSQHEAHVEGKITMDVPGNITAIELEYNTEQKIYHLTPITKRGRGCTLFFSKYYIGGYCDRNSTSLYTEGSIFF